MNNTRVFGATCQKVQQEVQVQQAASGEEVEILKHELCQSLAQGSRSQNLFCCV